MNIRHRFTSIHAIAPNRRTRMTIFRIGRPSPALVVSVVALIVALGGTSYAAFSLPRNSVGSKQLKKGAVTTTKIKNGAVTASKLNTTGVTVPNALHANSTSSAAHATAADTSSHAASADRAISASHAGTADTAGSAPPMAFAHVTRDGGLVGADSKNVGAVTKVGTSMYCFRAIPFAVHGGQAIVDLDDLGDGEALAQFGLGNDSGFCPADTQAHVFTNTAGSFAGEANSFFVEFYG